MPSRLAIDHGIRTTMPLAEAQALLESAVFLPHNPEADSRELQTLAHFCHRYSPVVGLEQSRDSHCLVLDITGCSHLFGSEFGLVRRLLTELAEQGYFGHAAAAKTIGAAWAIARYGHKTASDRRLRSLPVEALRIPDKLVSCLHEFDLRMIGQLRTLPRDALPSRFGVVLHERIDQMFGRTEELLEPVAQTESVSGQWTTDEPICHPQAIRHVCEDLLTDILSRVNSRSEGILRLTLTFRSEAAEPVLLEIGMSRPADSTKHVMNLLDLKLENQPIPEWVSSIEMESSITAPLRVRQQSLFEDDHPTDSSDTRRLIDRLSARLGQQVVVRPKLLPEATPEQAVTYESFAGLTTKPSDSTTTASTTLAPHRPLELCAKPERIEMSMNVATDHSSASFRWNQRSYRIAHATKPERIVAGWWQSTGSIRREYYQVETENGARLWLYRDGTGNWFLHGIFE